MEKINILFLYPGPIYRPDLPEFKDKYKILSQKFKGVIISWTASERLKSYKIDNFMFCGLVRKRGGILTKLKLALLCLKKHFFIRRKKDFR